MPFINLMRVGVFIVVFIAAYLGGPALETFMKAAPTWLLNGLSIAGAVLPAVGLGLILMYLGLDKYKWLFIIAFILVAFVSFSYMFAFVLIVGFIVLYRKYKHLIKVTDEAKGSTVEISKEALRASKLRLIFFFETSWNYEVMQGIGYLQHTADPTTHL